MSVISLSRLQALRDVNNPAASPMEAALLHALDWRPAAQPDSVFDAADRAAIEPLYGPELDAAEQEQILSTFYTNSLGITDPSVRRLNLDLITLSGFNPAQKDSSYTVVASDAFPVMATAPALPVYTVGHTADGQVEGVWQVAERVKANYPALANMETADLAEKIMQANDLGKVNSGAYPVLQLGQTLVVVPYPDCASERLNVAVQTLEAQLGAVICKNLLLALPVIAVLMFVNLPAALTALLAIAGTTLTAAQGYSVLKFLAQSAMGVEGCADRDGIRRVGADVKHNLAGVAAAGVGYGSARLAEIYGPQIAALFSGVIDIDALIMGAVSETTQVVGHVRSQSLTLGMFHVIPSYARSIYLHVFDASGQRCLLEITAPRGDVGQLVDDYVNGLRALPAGMSIPGGNIQLSASAKPGQPIWGVDRSDVKEFAQNVFDKAPNLLTRAVEDPRRLDSNNAYYLTLLNGLNSTVGQCGLSDALSKMLTMRLGGRSTTLRTICLTNPDEFKAMPGVTIRLVNELEGFLSAYGLRMGMTAEELAVFE